MTVTPVDPNFFPAHFYEYEDVWEPVSDRMTAACKAINGDLLLLKCPEMGAIYAAKQTHFGWRYTKPAPTETTPTIPVSKGDNPLRTLRKAYENAIAMHQIMDGNGYLEAEFFGGPIGSWVIP